MGAAAAASESRGAPDREIVRRCIVTGRSAPTARMVRFVVAPDGGVAPDVSGRLPGRGLWLTAARDIVERAGAKGAFARAAGTPVKVEPGLADRVEHLLAQRCVEIIGLARRAGRAIAGHDKVRAALARGDVALLLVACDGAPQGRQRMSARAGGDAVDVLRGGELGRAFGRDNTIFAAITDRAFAGRLREEAGRLGGFRNGGTQ